MRQKLYETGIDLLKRGYEIIAHDCDTYYHVTDGTHVVYIQNQYFSHVSVSVPYHPSRELGTACRVIDAATVGGVVRLFKDLKESNTPETLYNYNDILKEEKAVPVLYNTFKEWYDSLWDKDRTVRIKTVEEFKDRFDIQ
jgi:hypothetical protein